MKNKNKKAIERKPLQVDEEFLGPYIEMALCFAEDSEEGDAQVMMWAMTATQLKAINPKLTIIDLMPQNLERTIESMGINMDTPDDYARLLGLESYI